MSETKWKLNLDIKEFVVNTQVAKSALDSIADVKSFDGLLGTMKQLSVPLGLAAAGAFAVKKAFDFTVEAENIQSINAQFDRMASASGLAANEIRGKLVGAAGGLADDTEIIRAANRAMVNLGESADKLPQIMELSRKVTSTFGGELVDNFESIGRALSMGNTRMLKQYGIIVDTEKAVREFAKSLGVKSDALSEAGRRQAILNAALSEGEKRFAGADESIKQATNAWTKLTVAAGQFYEVFVVRIGGFFQKSFSGYFQNFADGLGVLTQKFRAATGSWGQDLETTNAQIDELQLKLHPLKERLDTFKSRGPLFAPEAAMLQKEVSGIEARLKSLYEAKAKFDAQDKAKAEEGAAKKGAAGDGLVDLEKKREAESKFQKDLLQLKKERLDAEMKGQAEFDDADLLARQQMAERKELLAQEFDLRREQIEQGYQHNQQQKAELLIQLEQTKNERLLQMDEELAQRRLAIMQKQTDDAKSMSEGITRAFKEGAEKNRQDLTDWGKTGRMVFQSFSKHSRQALLDFGAGTKTAGEAMRGFLFGAIADTAEAKGMELLLASLWPPNPLGMAAGAGLVALAGMLRSQAGGASSGLGGGVSAGGGAGPAGAGVEADRPQTLEAQKQKQVVLNVHGNYFETEQTKTRLVEMIRESSDATDFTIRSVGG